MADEPKPEDHWQRYMKMFAQESDRACVILTVSFLDELLTLILKTKLAAFHSSNDPLFDGANAPLASFSSKIDLAYRLGVLSSRLCRDLHVVRRIRNDFAHNIDGCHFSDQKVHNRVRELISSFRDLIEIYRTEETANIYQNGDRGDFQFCCSWMIDYLNRLSKSVVAIEEAAKEWAYDRPKMEHSKK